MFQFLMGVAFGAAGYWAWQSFGRDLLGMGGDQETIYGGFSSGTSGTSSNFGSGSGSTGTAIGANNSSAVGSATDPSTASGGSTPSAQD
jgi:hypothetical protein